MTMMRICFFLIVLGLSTYLGLLLNSSLAAESKASVLASPDGIEMLIPLQASEYTLNIRSELPVNLRIYSAISNLSIMSRDSIKEETISFSPPVNSIYVIDISTSSGDVCNVEIWMSSRGPPSTLISKICLIVSFSGLLLGLSSQIFRRVVKH